MRSPNSKITTLIIASTISPIIACVDTGSSTPTNATGGTTAAGGTGDQISDASSFRCVNWADTGDNFQAGVLQPSGLFSSDDYDTVLAKSDAILSGFQTALGANAIRIPINESTVVTNTAWWTAYKGIIDAAISKNMKTMIAYWVRPAAMEANPPT